MVTSRIVYRCDTCRAEYAILGAAKACEAIHSVEGFSAEFRRDAQKIVAKHKAHP